MTKNKLNQAVTKVAQFLVETAKDYVHLYPAEVHDARIKAMNKFLHAVGRNGDAAELVFREALVPNFLFDWLWAKEGAEQETGLPSFAELVCPELAATSLMLAQKDRAIRQDQGRADVVAIIAWAKLLGWSPKVLLTLVRNEPDNDHREAMCHFLGIPVPGADKETLVSDSSDLRVMFSEVTDALAKFKDGEEKISPKQRGQKRKELANRQKYVDALQIFIENASTNMAVALMQILFFDPGTVLCQKGETRKMPFSERLLTASRKAALEMRRETLDTWNASADIEGSADIEASAEIESSADVEASGFRF